MEIIERQDAKKEYEPEMSVKDWVITLLILMIPFVNIIMLFVWGFGDGTIKNKANYAKAQLVILLIGIAITIFFFLFIVSFGTFFEALSKL